MHKANVLHEVVSFYCLINTIKYHMKPMLQALDELAWNGSFLLMNLFDMLYETLTSRSRKIEAFCWEVIVNYHLKLTLQTYN